MRLAADVLDADVLDRGGDEAAPEGVVDLGNGRVGDDQGPERTCRRDDLGASVLDACEAGREAEHAHRVAQALEPGARIPGRLDARCGGEVGAEAEADLPEPARRDGVDQKPDQLRVAPLRKLDRGRLRRGRVHLGRPPGAGPGAARRSLEARR